MYTGIRTQLEAGRISFHQGGSAANSTRKLVEEFSFSPEGWDKDVNFD
jgi:hypothetical protein